MPWTSDSPYGGFSSCLSEKCHAILSSYDVDFMQTNVQVNNFIEFSTNLIFDFARIKKIITNRY